MNRTFNLCKRNKLSINELGNEIMNLINNFVKKMKAKMS